VFPSNELASIFVSPGQRKRATTGEVMALLKTVPRRVSVAGYITPCASAGKCRRW
jgi:hypothetical protein